MAAVGKLRWLVSGENFVSLQIVAKPGSSRRGILRRETRGLLIGLNSQPFEGRANDELITFLAGLLDTPRSSIAIIRGQTSRVKTIRIATLQPARVIALLQPYE
jgi:uncharacterized protein